MRIPPTPKTDLIISMTLAEIFLLMLFVLWYSQGAGAGPDWERIAKEQEQKITDLIARLQDKDQEISRLKKEVELWRTAFGVSPPVTIGKLRPFLHNGAGSGTKDARSNLTPKCSELGLKDVLFATVVQGPNLYELNGQGKKFGEIQLAYAVELQDARNRGCRYSVDVSYGKDVKTDDYVFALNRLRSIFYMGRLAK